METGEITISSISKIMQRISEPGIIANVWGRSGSGKTILALNLAFEKVLEGKKVLYFTDQLEGIQQKLQKVLGRDDLLLDFKKKIDECLKIVRIDNFKNQIEIVHELFTLFPPDEEITEAEIFKQFMEKDGKGIDSKIISSLKKYKKPALIIFDEFSRQYRELSLSSDPSHLSKLIGVQLGFLKRLARKHSIPVVLLNGTHTIKINAPGEERISYQEAPLVHFALEYWEDVNARLSYTENAGERILTFSDNRKGDFQEVDKIQINELYKRLLDT